MLGWIRRWRLNVAARRYARELSPRLRNDYGAGGRYTPAQIRTAAARCGLPLTYVSVGYAAFLDEAAFVAVADPAFKRDYRVLRAIIARHLPHGLRSADGDPLSAGSGGNYPSPGEHAP